MPNWETADEKKVPNSAREVQSASARAMAKRVGSLELRVWRKDELAERL